MEFRHSSLVWISLVSAGCHSADQPLAVVAAPQSKVAVAAAVETHAAVDDEAAPTDEAAEDVELADADFEPPFPSRIEMFVPPRGGQFAVRRSEEQGESIELKGFVDVNGPQVLLSIDGVLSPIAEGGEKYGVHVISINPPQVVLQRGRSRWTASLD